ncbi:acetyl/propionyl/methylcrotonyl-CoA carboxylase subunit alpha [Aeromicrobium stalagmiti]|uniref:acetyl/propionyl/methylcrotonyl-CoA carboxylase subunit alpha n=1 Tax=Aeromicrobium stalagmiti TaxID=2738988 RepID=UPI001568C619|nr:biotin carboxylase N-terminal domain-containing protein [Aeromicrobium stalagmiti]NRQ48890.1 biotin/lipoyl-binding protein [Aeromicrobium stalagmiti]
MITSVLVANRGEIARRVFRTCRELGIRTVAVFSDADESAPFVGEADVAVRLPGSAPSDTYLRGDLVIAAALKAGADAIHPGYGFLSENAQFARDVEAAGLVWIGPDPATIDAMGSKIRAKELMSAGGVPILSVDPAQGWIGPLLVKASAGGGGRGMRVVTDPDDLEGELAKAAAEAQSSFGDPTVFVEPYLPTARHIEVQVMADAHGTCWVVGDRDCSIQRRHQKVVEEAPAPDVSDAVRTVLHDAARAAVKAVDYRGAGTVEFLVADAHLETGTVYFLEMNTRLQVEHPVTEEVFGVDLVACQIAVAEGQALGREPEGPAGHAVEVRLYAEDPADGWQPQTGTVRTFEVGGDVRVDSGVESGSVVGIHYDAMIAKVVAHGPDRTTAVRRLDDALRRTRLHGVSTNLDFLRSILRDEEFGAARVHTALLDERLEQWTRPRLDEAAVRRLALAAAAAQASSASSTARVLGRIPAAFRNVPSQPRTRSYVTPAGDELTVSYSAGLVQHDLDGVAVVVATPTRVVLEVDGVTETYDVATGPGWVDVDGPHGSIDLSPLPRFVDPADAVAEGSLLAPMPAAVVSVAVTDGQQVAKGDVIVVLEAMKMQHTITAPTDGVVTQLSVTTGAQVESGAVLAVIEGEGS